MILKIRPANPQSAFTMIELLIVSTILVVVLSAMMVFTELTAKSALGITTQATINQQAGYTAQYLQERASLSVGMSNSADGTQLWFAFDADPDVDSDGDGASYNDTNRWEYCKLLDLDNDINTFGDNSLVYCPDATPDDPQEFALVDEGVRQLPGTNLFNVWDTKKVAINIGVLDPYVFDQTQIVEIKTVGLSRNTPQSF